MNQESELHRLERFVEKLLTTFSELRAEKAGLLQQLSDRDRQIEDLRNNLSTQEMERGEISQRVGKLVEQIEEWENSLDDDIDEAELAAVPPPSPEEPINEEQSISVEQSILDEYEVQEEIEESAADLRGEEEGRVQHNLFSMKSGQR
jgi:chromosome segregation ATPase